MIILDNGSIHKSKKARGFIKKHDWVELLFLPPYSPEYNPIERFWLWLKHKVYGCKSFAKMEDLVQQIRKLVWHFHEQRLVLKPIFNFHTYADLL
jgi:transposase